jgi:hypothetical protein
MKVKIKGTPAFTELKSKKSCREFPAGTNDSSEWTNQHVKHFNYKRQ